MSGKLIKCLEEVFREFLKHQSGRLYDKRERKKGKKGEVDLMLKEVCPAKHKSGRKESRKRNKKEGQS